MSTAQTLRTRGVYRQKTRSITGFGFGVIDRSSSVDLERDEIRLGPFFSCPGRGAARVLRAGVHSTLHGVVFAIFCPGPALHRRRDAMPGPGHEIVSASRLRDESIQLQHIVL